jgi:hypothetical protein
MRELFTLGELHVSDFLAKDQTPSPKVEMKMVMDESIGAARLEKCAPLNTMYGRYWYRSGINATMRNELKSIVENVNSLIKLNTGDMWIDIACNDGTLLSYLDKSLIRVGVDPADDSFKKESEQHANLIVQDYFNAEALRKSAYKDKKAKVITCIAMFYDLDNPDPFLKDVVELLDDEGLFVMQLSYTPLMIQQLAFDNICHEHIYYYSLFNLRKLLNRNGLEVVDCQLNDVNGGSFRVYIRKTNARPENFSTSPYRDVCDFRIQSLLTYEAEWELDKAPVWTYFFERINALKKETVNFLEQAKADGKIVWGYGASTKGNTLLQYFGIDNSLVEGIAERSPYKFGLRTVGTDIPIYSEEDMRFADPDYLLVLPWHFINEFKQRERAFLEKGGKFIVPCPKFEIIGAND